MMVTLRYRITSKGVVPIESVAEEKKKYKDIPKPKSEKIRAPDNDRSVKRRKTLNPATKGKPKENSSELINVVTPTPIEGRKSLDIEMSPEKAFHAASLKRRFANIIFKSTHQTLLDQGKKVDFVTMSREEERLRKEKIQDSAKIEAEVEAARKMRLQREREAARVKLEKMQKTVDIYGDMEIMKELEKMIRCGCQPSEILDLEEGEIASPRNVLHRLGLYYTDHD